MAGEKTKFKIVHTYKKPMERQVREGVEIYGAQVDILMNSKLDHYQPAIKSIVFTNQLRDK